MKKTCNVCGSDSISKKPFVEILSNSYAGKVETSKYTANYYCCDECGAKNEYEDVEPENEKSYEIAKKEITGSFVDIITNSKLNESGYSLAHTERALDLPIRTLTRWKHNNDTSAAGVALLKIIGTYPWIIKVAENNFQPDVACYEVINQAGKIVSSFIANNAFNYSWENTDNILFVSVNYSQYNDVSEKIEHYIEHYNKATAESDSLVAINI